jgi:hypothetical protein
MKAAAAAKTGLQRAAIHSNSGNSAVIGTAVAQYHSSGGKKIIPALNTTRIASAATPSMNSRRDGGSCNEEASPIKQRRNCYDAERAEQARQQVGSITLRLIPCYR